ncbi:hypothetical protein DRH14_03630, partial [Candidatus Shapirobacteria bacterium]
PQPTLSASAGINIINYTNNADYVPDQSLKIGPNSWMVYSPKSPNDLSSDLITADHVVIRLHSHWTNTGKKMLGTEQEQQQIAQQWCQTTNTFAQSGKQVFLEPFNELEHDYERDSTQGILDLNTAISRARSFISLLSKCTNLPITSPALDPQSVDFGTTSSAFSNFNIISCHPYRLDTLEKCKSIANGKQLIFTEIGVDKNGVKYDDCEFIDFFCKQSFIEKLQNTPNLIAYFLFSVSPGNFNGSWKLNNPDVVLALKGQCSDNLNCKKNLNQQISNIVNKIYSYKHKENKANPFLTRSNQNQGIKPGPLTTASGLIYKLRGNLSALLHHLFDPKTSSLDPFNYTAKFSEQYAEDVCAVSGDICSSKILYNIKSQDGQIIDDLWTISQQESIGILGKHTPKVDGHNPAYPRHSLNYYGPGEGPGQMYGLYTDPPDVFLPEGKKENDTNFYQLKSGVYPRVSSAHQHDNNQVNDFLCKLACSGDTNCINRHPDMKDGDGKIFDTVIAYSDEITEDDYKTLLPNGNIDRSQAEGTEKPFPIRISDVFCFNKDAVPLFLAEKCQPKYGPISTHVCDRTPDWKKQIEWFLFRKLWNRLKLYAVATENHPTKIFWEMCQEQDEKNCQANNPFSQKINVNHDFCHLTKEIRTQIIDEEHGAFSKKIGNDCLACKVITIFLPNFNRAYQYAQLVNQQTTPHRSHLSDEQTNSAVIDVQYNSKSIQHDDDIGMGVDNKKNDYDIKNRNHLMETALAFFTRNPPNNNKNCIIYYETEQSIDEEGVSHSETIPANSCHVTIKSKLKNNLCVPDTIYKLYENSHNYTSFFLPAQVNQTITDNIQEQSGSDIPIESIKNTCASTNNLGGKKSAKAMHESGETLSGNQIVENKPLVIGPTNEISEEIVKQSLLPVSWQN